MMVLLLFKSRRIDVLSHWGFLREREIRGLSSIFGAARKYGSGWIGQVILIGWKCSATLTVTLNYAPNKKYEFLSTTHPSLYLPSCILVIKAECAIYLFWYKLIVVFFQPIDFFNSLYEFWGFLKLNLNHWINFFLIPQKSSSKSI